MHPLTRPSVAAALLALAAPALSAQTAHPLHGTIDELAAAINDQVVEWRRDIHANPELGMQEFRTAALVAEHLRSARHRRDDRGGRHRRGGVLEGGRPGPVVALRADMDGLPVTELADVPFASKVTTEWQGREVGVMHACGHDNHVAILMGVASVLAEMRDELPGTVKFLFQPAEEGPGGAAPMIADGAMEDPDVDAVFGLHVFPMPVGTIATRPGGMLASSDGLRIVVRGVQTHGAMPWGGVDPIVTSSQIVMGLQQIVSRQTDLTDSPAVVTIGQIEGGNRGNIIPGHRADDRHDPDAQPGHTHRRPRTYPSDRREHRGSERRRSRGHHQPRLPRDGQRPRSHGAHAGIAAAGGGRRRDHDAADAGRGGLLVLRRRSTRLFLGLGVASDDPSLVHPNHSPYFHADERALPIGCARAGQPGGRLPDRHADLGGIGAPAGGLRRLARSLQRDVPGRLERSGTPRVPPGETVGGYGAS